MEILLPKKNPCNTCPFLEDMHARCTLVKPPEDEPFFNCIQHDGYKGGKIQPEWCPLLTSTVIVKLENYKYD